MRMMLKLGGIALGTMLLVAGSAQALSLEVHKAKRARVTQTDENTIVFSSRRGRGRASFTVSLADSGGLASIASVTETEVDFLIVKRNGKRKHRTIMLEGNEHEFNMRGKRRVRMTYPPDNVVPEPGTLALLGLGLGGLALAGRRQA